MKIVIIQASSRSVGNTSKVVGQIKKLTYSDVIDINTMNIHPYSYDHPNIDDDFIPVMKRVVEYDLIVMATPIYWYAMSGLLKNFLDRFTDCLKIEKELGRKLRGKKLAAIACGSEKEEVPGFFIPFEMSANYLGMEYQGHIHTYINDNDISKDVMERLNQFTLLLSKK